jgi:hypothetical protein
LRFQLDLGKFETPIQNTIERVSNSETLYTTTTYDFDQKRVSLRRGFLSGSYSFFYEIQATHRLTPDAERSVAGRFAFWASSRNGLRRFRGVRQMSRFRDAKPGSRKGPSSSLPQARNFGLEISVSRINRALELTTRSLSRARKGRAARHVYSRMGRTPKATDGSLVQTDSIRALPGVFGDAPNHL